MAEIKDDHTDRLVALIPKSLKKRLRDIVRDLEDLEDKDPTLTRVVNDILSNGIDAYELAVKRRIDKAKS